MLALVRRVAGAPEGATWWRGLDLVAVARAADPVAPLPTLDEERGETRLAALVMTEAGHSQKVTEARLGKHARQISRWLDEQGGGCGA
ncbi:hypothetical protein [Streptomyces sp. AD55]|uniref:hypothetical protein n=1 Tax=Streptomyces sp. AD55 TaxID=3242895 RepID=UPI003527E3C0